MNLHCMSSALYWYFGQDGFSFKNMLFKYSNKQSKAQNTTHTERESVEKDMLIMKRFQG